MYHMLSRAIDLDLTKLLHVALGELFGLVDGFYTRCDVLLGTNPCRYHIECRTEFDQDPLWSCPPQAHYQFLTH